MVGGVELRRDDEELLFLRRDVDGEFLRVLTVDLDLCLLMAYDII